MLAAKIPYHAAKDIAPNAITRGTRKNSSCTAGIHKCFNRMSTTNTFRGFLTCHITLPALWSKYFSTNFNMAKTQASITTYGRTMYTLVISLPSFLVSFDYNQHILTLNSYIILIHPITTFVNMLHI